MRYTVNFFAQSLDEANECKQEIGVVDGHIQGSNFDEKKEDENDKQTFWGKCYNKIVIRPSQSSWLVPWRYFIHLILFYGYFHDPYHIAFKLT